LEVNDIVRAKIIAVSLGGGRSGKLGLSMRSPYLGKNDWIEEDIEAYYERKEGKGEKEEESE
jgi:DNA-directed RNA polymerase subunit E'/Rpb7